MGGLLIMSGLVGAAVTGIIVDKYGQFELVGILFEGKQFFDRGVISS